MRLSIPALVAFAASGLCAPAAEEPGKKYPLCSSEISKPCRCPLGTQYLEAATTGIIGANAHDVSNLIADFYNISWQLGAVPYKTKGPNNKVGSIRSVKYPIVPTGMEDVDERLVARKVSRDGSFFYSFEQVQPTIPYPDGSGVFAGYWGTMSAIAQTGDETIVTWTNWACETAHIRNFAGFHELALQNATDILVAQYRVLGQNVAPDSAQNF